jgi:hypothetical protein
MAYKDYSKNKEFFEKELEYCKNLKVGDKVKFSSEKQRYTVREKSEKFIICTKPFNVKKTVLYTIIDLERLVRGTNDRVFNPYDYMIQEDIEECLRDLELCKVEVSHRNCVMLDIEVPSN